MSKREFHNIKCVSDDLRKYDILAKEHDFIQVCEWSNGNGWDISFNDKVISLTFGQLDAINYLIKVLEYDSNR